MRNTAIIFVLILSGVWGYTSWYWYTCKIKWICNIQTLTPDQVGSTRPISADTKQDILQAQDTKSQILAASQEENGENTQPSKNSETRQQIQPVAETQTSQEENWVSETQEENQQTCEDIIISAIWLGWKNNPEEVKKLETFLNTVQWWSLEINGIYEQADFEAVKDFQLQYKEEILDPWNIETPTGYVYRTTIQKINEIHCNN